MPGMKPRVLSRQHKTIFETSSRIPGTFDFTVKDKTTRHLGSDAGTGLPPFSGQSGKLKAPVSQALPDLYTYNLIKKYPK
jgi:hypothetical protein